MIVTIDGPAGSGKSTAARQLADCLGFQFLDTGAMYRAVAVAFLFRSIDSNDGVAIAATLAGLHIDFSGTKVLLNGQDVSLMIRTPEASQGASRVAVIPAVRRHLAAEQRRIAAGGNYVCEGRDQGAGIDAAVLHLRATVRQREHVLGPALDELHRAAELEREARGHDALG